MLTPPRTVLADRLWQADGSALLVKRVLLVMLGVAVLAMSAKLRFPVPPSPVPVTMGTFAVLALGAAYGPRLGLVTILAYMVIGALGFDVFAGTGAQNSGLAYMLGGTGGYLLGYVLATAVLGALALRGWDRSVPLMALAMLIGNAVIYLPGLAWLSTFAESWAQTLTWGITPFLIGDALKLGLAALLLPAVWKLIGDARG